MWSTERLRLSAALAAVAALAGACAGGPAAGPSANGRVADALTPLDHYPVRLAEKTEAVALAVHPQGALSPAQETALAGLAQTWRDAGGSSAVAVQGPAAGGPDAQIEVQVVAGRLAALGVPPEALRIGAYESGPDPAAPVTVRFERLAAVGPDCDRGWDNLTSTLHNGESQHFGCANAHNFAAMLADPHDLQAPRPLDPADPGRRAAVLDAYRKGSVTSSAKDAGASGAISQAVH